MNQSWRRELPVLVADAETLGAIGAIRSLGRAGYPVHGCSRRPMALGMRSRYCGASAVCPDYRRPEFVDWLRRYLSDHGIRAIVPSAPFMRAIRPVYGELAALVPLPDREDVVFRGLSKTDVHRAFTEAGGNVAENLPPSLCVEALQSDVSEWELARLGRPLFLKVDSCHSRTGESGKVIRAQTASEAADILAALRPRFEKVLVQGYVPGRGVGSFFLVWNGEVLASFQHRRIHEVPHTGGVSSFRESFSHPAIEADALLKIRCLDWRGVGMLEYRLDESTGRHHFIEFNGRFWGSLHLALFAGVDFPTLLLDAFHGHPQPLPTYRLGVRCRNTIQEVQYVWSRLKDGQLGLGARGWSVLEFVLLSFDPRLYQDLLYSGDRGLWFIANRRALGRLFNGLPSRLRWRRESGAQGTEMPSLSGEQEVGIVRSGAPADGQPVAHPVLPRLVDR